MTLVENNSMQPIENHIDSMPTEDLANMASGTWQHRVYKAEMEVQRLKADLIARPTVTKYETKYLNDGDLQEAKSDAEDVQDKIKDLLDELNSLDNDIDTAVGEIDEVLEQGSNANGAIERIEEIKNQVQYVDF
jgi:peptidoglycan hydrolase CwlO-like protein|tara:strand:- start:560 stop:961 length:402 start_codon:yes stop_codon:yes gene_type:complete